MGLKSHGPEDSDSESYDGMSLPPGLQSIPGIPSYGHLSIKSALKKPDQDSGSEEAYPNQVSPEVSKSLADSQIARSVRYEDEVRITIYQMIFSFIKVLEQLLWKRIKCIFSFCHNHI